MAAITCPSCKATVNEFAASCAACGADPRRGAPGLFAATDGGLTLSAWRDRLGAVFTAAWLLYRRNVRSLSVAGGLAALIEIAAVLAATAIARAHDPSLTLSTATASGLTRSIIHGVLGGLISVAAGAFLVSQVLVLGVRGGAMTMLLDNARHDRTADLAALFAPRQLKSYLGLWGFTGFLAPFGWAAVLYMVSRILGPTALVVASVGSVGLIWLAVIWLYALPLIADRDFGPVAALDTSQKMAEHAGWWKTFAAVSPVGIVLVAIALCAHAVGHGSTWSSCVAIVVAELGVLPCALCLVASLYLVAEPAATGVSSVEPGLALAHTVGAVAARPAVTPSAPRRAVTPSAPSPNVSDGARIAAAAAAWTAAAKKQPPADSA